MREKERESCLIWKRWGWKQGKKEETIKKNRKKREIEKRVVIFVVERFSHTNSMEMKRKKEMMMIPCHILSRVLRE
jgi:hypothetical protein